MYDVTTGKINRWNTRMEELMGFSRNEMIELKYYELVCENDRDLAARKLEETVRFGKGKRK